MEPFEPKLSALPAPQQRLWSELSAVPHGFVLYGGTGLALRLGHRASVDFDFFSHPPLNRELLSRAVPFLRNAEVLQEEPNALTVSVDREGPVKVSFFGTIDFGRVGVPQRTTDGAVQVASLLDLGATKVKVLLQRVDAKDYLDIAALLRAGVALSGILGAARTLYGSSFNPLVAQKALAWFEGGDFSRLPPEDRQLLLREATKDIEFPDVPRLSSQLA